MTTATLNRTPNPVADVIGNSLSPIHRESLIHIVDTPNTMSSLEIAKLTGRRHDNVMHDIRQQLEELGQDALELQGSYKDSYNRSKPCFNLPRREVDILLSGYSTAMRAAVVDRWLELEAERKLGSLAIPNNLAGALMLASVLEGERSILAYQVETLKQQVAEDAEKVEFFNEIADTKQLSSVSTVAKTLGTGQKRLFAYMRNHKILMSNRHRLNEPYQEHQEAGRFVIKWGNYKDKVTGEIECKVIPFFTGKGVIWIEKFIAEHGRDGL